jgi:hypothetical protein
LYNAPGGYDTLATFDQSNCGIDSTSMTESHLDKQRNLCIPSVHLSKPMAARGDRVELASVSELEHYGAAIEAELAGAEAELSAPRTRPFAGMTAEVMADVNRLRADQLDVFRQHVEIEQRYRVPHAGADADDVSGISFSSIAGSMREKELATTQLLDKLDTFDRDLRRVFGKFETVGHNPAAPADEAVAAEPRTRPPRQPCAAPSASSSAIASPKSPLPPPKQ